MKEIIRKHKHLILVIFWGITILLGICSKVYSQENMKTFLFKDIMWHNKISKEHVGPGNNIFGVHRHNVVFDRNGNINLKIKKISDGYSCAEFYSDTLFSAGRFETIIKTNIKHFSPQMVLGIFLYDATAEPHYNEIDIELAQWGNTDDNNAQFAMHTNNKLQVHRFLIPSKKKVTKHIIDISDHNIMISSLFYNKKTDQYEKIEEKTLKKPEEFKFLNTRFHFNLWLTDNLNKQVGKNPKVKITSFKYTPYSIN
ncbi:family 16 glycosylhydrolase [Plebeiibacterium sediminum]|uniref:Family 16 glycosylhydrolase n=1 Tax=Plebeiibacterium sediminum TaxID=2992112 RepID=A0AAE3SEQ5_9BACT|nr:family 16 glycosylhydrolase [Plebeiobacterium sediminum]MCW3786257.1 family 16 glycosylhydrolase [Plebeiobacterium sediminum]